MKKKLPKFANRIWRATKKHSPEILTGMGIAGMITTTIMAVKVTPKAVYLINDEVHNRIVNNKLDKDGNIEGLVSVDYQKYGYYYKLPIKDAIKLTWKCYIPSAIVGGLSIICVLGANSVNLRRNTALAAAYTFSENTLKEYQEQVIESIGEKKEKEISDTIAKKKVDAVEESEILYSNNGETLCYDAVSGRLFKSDINNIEKAVNDLNKRLLTEMYIPLNDFYYEIGLDSVKLGEDLGWNIDKGLIDIKFRSTLYKGKKPCLVLDYRVIPEYNYFR